MATTECGHHCAAGDDCRVQTWHAHGGVETGDGERHGGGGAWREQAEQSSPLGRTTHPLLAHVCHCHWPITFSVLLLVHYIYYSSSTFLAHNCLLHQSAMSLLTQHRNILPGNTPCAPLIRPVHQSSALSVFSTSSILSPALNDRSPSVYLKVRHDPPYLNSLVKRTCAAKSYSATTYLICGAALGFGFNGGGGGGARFVAAADEAADATLAVAEYGGGASDAELDGGGGGAFLKDEAEEADRAGGGAALREGLVDANADDEAFLPNSGFVRGSAVPVVLQSFVQSRVCSGQWTQHNLQTDTIRFTIPRFSIRLQASVRLFSYSSTICAPGRFEMSYLQSSGETVKLF